MDAEAYPFALELTRLQIRKARLAQLKAQSGGGISSSGSGANQEDQRQ
jgi:hypothetical protein